jgi:hypothetical protein
MTEPEGTCADLPIGSLVLAHADPVTLGLESKTLSRNVDHGRFLNPKHQQCTPVFDTRLDTVSENGRKHMVLEANVSAATRCAIMK